MGKSCPRGWIMSVGFVFPCVCTDWFFFLGWDGFWWRLVAWSEGERGGVIQYNVLSAFNQHCQGAKLALLGGSVKQPGTQVGFPICAWGASSVRLHCRWEWWKWELQFPPLPMDAAQKPSQPSKHLPWLPKLDEMAWYFFTQDNLHKDSRVTVHVLNLLPGEQPPTSAPGHT